MDKEVEEPNHNPEDLINPSGIQLSQYLPTRADGAGEKTAPLSIKPDMNFKSALPTFNNYDYSKLYQASAILNEHDFTARAEATRRMAEEEEYSKYEYGNADYFVVWQKLVKEEYNKLERLEGPARFSYDGATGLPLVSLYQAEFLQNRRTGRRHSLAIPVKALKGESKPVESRKNEIRRMSLSQLELMKTYDQLHEQSGKT